MLVVTTCVCLETDVCLEIYRGLCPKTQVSWHGFILSWVSVCVSRGQVHTIQLLGWVFLCVLSQVSLWERGRVCCGEWHRCEAACRSWAECDSIQTGGFTGHGRTQGAAIQNGRQPQPACLHMYVVLHIYICSLKSILTVFYHLFKVHLHLLVHWRATKDDI